MRRSAGLGTVFGSFVAGAAGVWSLAGAVLAAPADPPSWTKLSPLETTPASPQLGYEGACAWDCVHDVLIRYGGHNQGGGGEQGSEIWTFDPKTARWDLKEPDVSPPGVCCAQQNVFDPTLGRYLRFPAFSGSHGWQWWREIYLNDSSVWSYDLGANVWRNHRPLPTANPRPLRCASWDSRHEVVVIFGGETSREGTLVYDPYTNVWKSMDPSSQPEFRSGGNLCYDAERAVHILFGSQFDDDRHTWIYDLARNEWRDAKPDLMPPTRQNDAVLAYDERARVVVAVVKITTGEDEAARHSLETWIYDAGTNRWSRLEPGREPDPSGNRARVIVAAPEAGGVLLENRPHPPGGPHEQQIWALGMAEADARGDLPKAGEEAEARPAPEPSALQPPSDLRALTTPSGGVRLMWRPSPSPGVVRYDVYSGRGEWPWEVAFEKVGEAEPRPGRWGDDSLEKGIVHHYYLRAVGADGSASPPSRRARTQPRIVEDVVVSVLDEREVEIIWKASAASDVRGYAIERAPVRVLTEDQLLRLKKRTPPLGEPSVGAIENVGSFERLTEDVVTGTRFIDGSADLSHAPTADPARPEGRLTYERRFHEEELDSHGKPYRFAVFAYRVRAVNSLGVESGPSAAILTIPSPPRYVFAREEGTTCHLKWAPSREGELRGYRVYRLDGRWDADPLSRLTPDPVAATLFSDLDAGSDTRRYHVVAVDSLGQEGFPSSPVWFDREWRRYYEPFVGEWHQ